MKKYICAVLIVAFIAVTGCDGVYENNIPVDVDAVTESTPLNNEKNKDNIETVQETEKETEIETQTETVTVSVTETVKETEKATQKATSVQNTTPAETGPKPAETAPTGVTDKSTFSQKKIDSLLVNVSGKQRQACSYALAKVGYPYSQMYRDSGKYYDCSSLVYYAWKTAGVNLSYYDSYNAADECKVLEKAGKGVAYKDIQPGDLIFYSGWVNGRYRNITHVTMYIGDNKMVEAHSPNLGVIYSDVRSGYVFIGRP